MSGFAAARFFLLSSVKYPESRVNDMIMRFDLTHQDIPVKIEKDEFEKVCEYNLSVKFLWLWKRHQS